MNRHVAVKLISTRDYCKCVCVALGANVRFGEQVIQFACSAQMYSKYIMACNTIYQSVKC